jgi:hypothetical protein
LEEDFSAFSAEGFAGAIFFCAIRVTSSSLLDRCVVPD